MYYQVIFSNSKSNSRSAFVRQREGRLVYRHPKNYYVVLEFRGRGGRFREAFWPEDVIRVG